MADAVEEIAKKIRERREAREKMIVKMGGTLADAMTRIAKMDIDDDRDDKAKKDALISLGI